jgi:hypothetical protein
MLHILGNGAPAGGSTVAGSAFGGAGVNFNFTGGGSVTSGETQPSAIPALPPPPTNGTVLAALSTDYTQASGNILIPGTITASGAATRTITATQGDIVVSGAILSGQNAGSQINLALSAPHGTIFVTGFILTGSADGVANGTPSGSVSLTASLVLVTGSIDATGEANTAGAGAAGGAVTINTSSGSGIVLAGSIVLNGGNGTGGNGGAAGALTATAGTGIYVAGLIRGDGGATSVSTTSPTGGAGSFLLLTGPAGVNINATLEMIGGDATTTGMGAFGGNPGGFNAVATTGRVELFGVVTIRGGAATAGSASPGTPVIAGPVTILCAISGAGGVDLGLLDIGAVGGASSDSGGQGGKFQFNSSAGDVRIQGLVDASSGSGTNTGGLTGSIASTTQTGDVIFNATLLARGGMGGVVPGPGGSAHFTSAASGTTAGRTWLNGVIDTSGGSSTSTATVNGGDAGPVTAESLGVDGTVLLDTVLTIRADGGGASGGGTGGTGGVISVSTLNDVIQIGAQIHAQGGNAPSSSGTGGLGGRVSVDTDSNTDGVNGDITLYAGAVITVSGGSGLVGGSARRGLPGSKAVEFDADGANANSGSGGLVSNFGVIIAEGGRSGGDGGDVRFDGLNNGLTPGPDPGIQSRVGNGGGLNGAFLSQ